MIIDFESRRTTLVATPVDGRCGLSSLTQIAESILGIKVTEGADYVVFISKARKICRIIFWDELGGCVITRRLNSGRFARYLMSGRLGRKEARLKAELAKQAAQQMA